ncbi:MAG: protein kinase [Anaerolineales bacterium]|nr:protein kinase [Anaerolineales bacterium]
MLAIHLLGKFEIVVDGRPVDLPLRAGQALLAYLALNAGAAVRRELLAGLLWPDMAEATAKANLRHTLWRVRKALGPAGTLLAADEAAISLGPADTLWLDAGGIGAPAAETSLEALMAVVAAYQGELLPGFYDDWVLLERERLQAAYEAKMDPLLEKLTAAERWGAVLEWGERWIALGRVPEAAYRALIVAHGARGDASQAAGVYRRCVEALRRELGVSPAAATRAAYEQALQAAGQPPVMSGEPLPALRGYELRERIGAGAYGEVYRAIQPSVERAVAIKVIAPAHADRPEFIRRFEAEARLVARLEHPHIVPLYDYWREPGGAYLVMRYLRGGNLREARPSGPWPLERVVQLAEQVGGALQAAHRQGVAHGDVKPENILLDEAGNAYLSDFGIVAGLAGASGAAALTARHDLYGLGLILRYLLAGAELPPAVLAVLDQATHPEPDQRFADGPALLAALRQAADEPRPAGAETELVNPYKGLRPFEAADEADFFGRQALVKRLLGRLAEAGPAARCLAVVGPSGSGKSSVVKAGLLPALRRGALPGSQAWYVAELTPGPHPLRELEQALLRVAQTRPAGLLEQLRRDAHGLERAARQILPEAGAQLLLVIDQFEEVFSPAVDPAEAEHLLASLAAAAVEPDGPVRVLLTLRADFYDRPLLHAGLADVLRARTEVVTPLTADEIVQAVRGPAERAGAEVEPDLSAALAADVVGQPGSLPLLQYALTEVFERRQGRRLTLEAYHALGGTTGALARRAEAVYAALEAEAQILARQVFLRLVTLGEGVEDTRRRALRSELEALGGGWLVDRGQPPVSGDHSPLTTILDSFGKARLLTFDRDPATRTPTVELAHEALLREWGRLRGWLDESRADVRLQRALAQAAAEWAAGGRDDGFLLAGARLAQFEAWMAAATVGLTPAERAYYDASLVERERHVQAEADRQQRELETVRQLAAAERARADEQVRALSRVRLRNRLIAAAGGVALVLALVAGFFSFQANQNLGAAQAANTQSAANAAQAQANARMAESNAAAAQAEAVVRATAQAAAEASRQEAEAQEQEALKQAAVGIAAQAVLELGGTNPERAVLLALEALEHYPYVPQAESALARAVQEVAPYSELVNEYTNYGKYPNIAWSPDGRWLVTASQSVVAETMRPAIWDVATGQVKVFLQTEFEYLIGGYGCHPADVVWSPDSQQIAVFVLGVDPADPTRSLPQCDRIEIFDAATGGLRLKFSTPGQLAGDWSPDGRWLVTGGRDGMVRLWEAATGRRQGEWRGHAFLFDAVAFSPDGRQIATGATDGTWRLWDAASGRLLGSYGQAVPPASAVYNKDQMLQLEGVRALDWSPDGDYLAVSTANREILLWDVARQETAMTLLGLTSPASAIAWAPNGKTVSACADSYTFLWAVNEPVPTRLAYDSGMRVAECYTTWSPDSRRLAVGKSEGLLLLDVSVLPPVVAADPRDHYSFAAIWSPDGSKLAGCRYVYDGAHDYAATRWNEGADDETYACGFMAAWRPDSQSFLNARSGPAQAHGFFEAETGALLLPAKTPFLAEGGYFHFAVSPDGQTAASGAFPPELFLWDARTGEQLARSGPLDCFPLRPKFSPDSGYVSAGCIFGAVDGPVRIWEARTGVLVHEIASDLGQSRPGVWSPDGRWLAVAYASGAIRLYDAQTWELRQTFATPANELWDLFWSPNGQRLVGFGSGMQFVLNAADGAVVMQLANDGDSYGDVSPDGQFISIGHVSPDNVFIRRMWQTTADLIAYAREHFVWRELTPDERTQFGLPPAP